MARNGVPFRPERSVRWLPALALIVVLVFARQSAAGPLTGVSWDGAPPGTLADVYGQSTFSFGLSPFSSGIYQVTWLGGFSAWRGATTIGAGTDVVFDPGGIAAGTEKTIAMSDPWTLWATTPDLDHAESTGLQWAFTATGANSWQWGLEDIMVGRCDCDYQDAYGSLVRIGDFPTAVSPVHLAGTTDSPNGGDSNGGDPNTGGPNVPPTTTPTPIFTSSANPPGGLGDQPVTLTEVPEPGTIALLTIGLAGLGARRRARQR